MSSLVNRALTWVRRLWDSAAGLKHRATAYAGAHVSRLLSDWVFAASLPADDEVRWDLRKLRARARELVRNNPYAARFQALMGHNVIGFRGIRLQAQVTKGDGEPDVAMNREIEDAWAEWGEPDTASIDGRLSWTDIQHAAVRGLLGADGEALLRMIPGAPNRFGFTLQLLDPDQLDEDYSEPPDEAGKEIRMGVEMDKRGRPLAYHVWDRHPRGRTAAEAQRRRIPADQVIHLYLPDRPGQSRGVTRFAPILTDVKMLDGYQEAELVAARVAAAKMGFFIPDPENSLDPNTPAGSQTSLTMEAEPGKLPTLPAGWDFKAWEPDHPTTAFGDFTKAILRSVASGLDVSYSSLTGDLRDVNYSSIRAGLLQERDVYRRLQEWVSTHLHARVYRNWLTWAITTRAVGLSVLDLSRARAVAWMPRGWAWVDPLKDTQAAVLAIRSGLSTLTRELANQGYDFEEILQERRKELQLMEEYGITVSTALSPDGGEGEEAGEPASVALLAAGD